ncbi:hypothetical protein [Dubosiella newyorkensis]|uniref:hypothetical protein n=2 Tax=Dubosiella newyorkensis TaxID=1862672 RepID=UPI00272D77B0|nr:hypothetical protein [Dubosiella newyorkensis]
MLFSILYSLFMLPLSIAGWFFYGDLFTKIVIVGILFLISYLFKDKAIAFWGGFGVLFVIDLIISFLVTSARFGLPPALYEYFSNVFSDLFSSVGSALLWVCLIVVGFFVIGWLVFWAIDSLSFLRRSRTRTSYPRDFSYPSESVSYPSSTASDPTPKKPVQKSPGKKESPEMFKRLEKEYANIKEKFTIEQLARRGFISSHIKTAEDVLSAHKTITLYRKKGTTALKVENNESILIDLYKHVNQLNSSETKKSVISYLKSRKYLENLYSNRGDFEQRSIAEVRLKFAKEALDMLS